MIDHWIEDILKNYLHKKRDQHIDKALNDFIEKYHPDPQIINTLKKKLEVEADRLFPLADQSILHERIQRAKYTFWVTAIASSITAAIILFLTHGSAIIFVMPICAATVAWAVTIVTIPIGYDARMAGGMDSTVSQFEKTLFSKNIAIENLHDMEELKNIIKTLNEKIEILSNQVNELTSVVNNPIQNKPSLPAISQSKSAFFTAQTKNTASENLFMNVINGFICSF